MIVIEDINYSIDDIIEQIDKEFGFTFVRDTEDNSKGWMILASGIRLYLEFSESERSLKSAEIGFPSMRIDIGKSKSAAELYSTSIESAVQVVDLVKRMLGGSQDEENND